MNNRVQCVLAALAALWLSGCAHHTKLPPPEPAAIQSLTDQLVALNKSVRPEEANRLSVCAYGYSLKLAGQYRAVRPAWWHNVLVNLGLKKRGLCYQWAEDLTVEFRKLHLFTLEFHWAVARPDTMREHNGVVVCARGQPFDEGIILDAWRHSGRLYWALVAQDRYPWRKGKDLPEEVGRPSIGVLRTGTGFAEPNWVPWASVLCGEPAGPVAAAPRLESPGAGNYFWLPGGAASGVSDDGAAAGPMP